MYDSDVCDVGTTDRSSNRNVGGLVLKGRKFMKAEFECLVIGYYSLLLLL
jgi:hypothetical protein